MAKSVLFFIIRLIIITASTVGICLAPEIRAVEQFWFFTIQTNIITSIICLILCACQVLNWLGIKTSFIKSKAFVFIQTTSTFLITITGLIYCFVLAPADIFYLGTPFFKTFDVRDSLLHIVVPVLAIIDHLINSKKGSLKYSYAPFLLLYPALYFALVNLRVIFGGKPFSSGSLYPYFFLDPAQNAQGWGMVCVYLFVICLIFYGLACLYILADKKLARRKKK